jgi:hypothetical protein
LGGVVSSTERVQRAAKDDLLQPGCLVQGCDQRLGRAHVRISVELGIHKRLAVFLGQPAGHREQHHILARDQLAHLVPVAAFHDQHPIRNCAEFRHAGLASRSHADGVAQVFEVAGGRKSGIGGANNSNVHNSAPNKISKTVL